MSSSTAAGVGDGFSGEGVELVRGVGVFGEGVGSVGAVPSLVEGSVGAVPSFVDGSVGAVLSLVVSIVVNKTGSVPKNTGSDSGPNPALVRAEIVTL